MFDIPERPLDPPEDEVYGYCDQCGREIYDGEDVYDIDGHTIHEDCLLDYAREHLAVRREASIYAEACC